MIRAHDFLGGSLSGNLAASVAGPRAEVQQIIRGGNNLPIVLDHHQGITQIAQVGQGPQQAAVVSGMETNGRLIQHVENAADATADLARQTDTLRFPSGKGLRGPAQSQIIEPHIDQELQAVGDLPQ